MVGAAVTLGLAGAVAVRLGKLPIELLTVPPHPAASNPAATRVTGRESLFAERRMLRRCGGLGWTMVGVPPGSALETAIGLTNLTALTRTAPASEQQGCDPSVTVSS